MITIKLVKSDLLNGTDQVNNFAVNLFTAFSDGVAYFNGQRGEIIC
jgi:hypothetical protein